MRSRASLSAVGLAVVAGYAVYRRRPRTVAAIDPVIPRADLVASFREWDGTLTPEQTRRLSDDLVSTSFEVLLPRSVERRLRAALHRFNAEILAAGGDVDFFHVDEDVASTLISAAMTGLREWEIAAHVNYDEVSGLAVDDLKER